MGNLIGAPGGIALTRRAVDCCSFKAGASIGDIGCGSGETVALLRDAYGFNAVGIDCDEGLVRALARGDIRHGCAEHMPLDDASMDGLIFQCSLSKMAHMAAVLEECTRVLKPGGLLVVTDLYARGRGHRFEGMLYRVEPWDCLSRAFEAAGYGLLVFEDHSDALTQLWGELVFRHGAEGLLSDLGADRDTLRQVKCGYYLAIYRQGALPEGKV